MPTRRYVNNRYKGFMKYLNRSIEWYEWECEKIEEERAVILDRYEKVQNEREELREFTLFLYINHQWNSVRPIKQVAYPGITNEYSSYAWKLTEQFLEEGLDVMKEEVIYQYVKCCYSGMCRKPEKCTEEMQQLAKNIREVTETLLKKEKNEENNYWRDIVFNYWKDMLFKFYNETLGKMVSERLGHIYWVRKELEALEKHQDEWLDEYGDDYPLVLYINHLLNTQHLRKEYYPGLPYYYKKYAWEIVNEFNKGEESLYDIVFNTVLHMKQIGYRYNTQYLKWSVYSLGQQLKKEYKEFDIEKHAPMKLMVY